MRCHETVLPRWRPYPKSRGRCYGVSVFRGLGDESFPCFVGMGRIVSATSERCDLMIWEVSLGWPRGFLLSLGLAFGLDLVDGKRL
jgi:hypothetical protein